MNKCQFEYCHNNQAYSKGSVSDAVEMQFTCVKCYHVKNCMELVNQHNAELFQRKSNLLKYGFSS